MSNMALTFIHIVLTIVLLRSEHSFQQRQKSVCIKTNAGCVDFRNKKDDFASLEQCLKTCSVQKVPAAESVTAHLCVDIMSTCTPLTYYKIFSPKNHFLDYTGCLQVCHLLKNGNRRIAAQVDICKSENEDCFPFAMKGTVDGFMKCYLECQAVWKDKHTRAHSRFICHPNLSTCVSTLFYTLPKEAQPHNVLKKCYQACEATASTADHFKCSQSSQQCVPCSDGEEDCVAESACKATCKEDTTPWKTDQFRCDEDSQKCVLCTMKGHYCMEHFECKEECENEDED